MIDITEMLRFLVKLYSMFQVFAGYIWDFLSFEIGWSDFSFTVLELLVGSGFTAYVVWKSL